MNKMSITDPFGSSNLSIKGKLIYIFQMNHPFQVVKNHRYSNKSSNRDFYYMRVHFVLKCLTYF